MERLTDGHEDDHQHEGVEHGGQGGGEGGDDVLERGQAAEDADDAEGPDDAQDGDVDVKRAEGDEGEGDDGDVDYVVAAGDEGCEPVGVGVGEELGGEDDSKGDVDAVKEKSDRGEAAVLPDELPVQLGLRGVDDEVLRARRRAVCDVRRASSCSDG
jgi:hypothetical protein